MFGCFNEVYSGGLVLLLLLFCFVLSSPAQVVSVALYYEKHEFCTENLMTFDSCDYYGAQGLRE